MMLQLEGVDNAIYLAIHVLEAQKIVQAAALDGNLIPISRNVCLLILCFKSLIFALKVNTTILKLHNALTVNQVAKHATP